MMNKHRWSKQSISVCLFLMMVLLAISAGYYKNAVAQERVYFRLNLPQQIPQTVMIDMAGQGWPKYFMQPGRITISSGAGGIKNTSKELLCLKIKLKNFAKDVQISSNSHQLEAEDENYLVQLEPGEKMSLAIELNLPRGEVYDSRTRTATLEFVDQNNQHLLGQVAFHLRNSRNSSNVVIP
jgi:hypothetical protein